MTAHAHPVSATQAPMATRYLLSVTAGATKVTQDCPTLDIAETAFDRFCERERGNWNAVAEIFDRETQATVSRWTGFPKPKPVPSLEDIFARLIARGEPVSVIGPHGSAHFGATPMNARKDRADV